DTLRWVALETVGRLGLADMADEAAASSNHPDPELRAATFRCLRRLGSVPETAEAPLLDAVDDEVDFVRVQAAHAAGFLSAEAALPRLEPHLEDASRWSAGPPRRRWRAWERSASPPSGGPPSRIPTRPPVRWPCRSC